MLLIIITSVILHFATKLGNYYHSLIFKSILKLENSKFSMEIFLTEFLYTDFINYFKMSLTIVETLTLIGDYGENKFFINFINGIKI